MNLELNAIHSSNPSNQNLTWHQFIAQYVDALANSLSVWDNSQQSISYYKKLAWAGLESSTVYASLTQVQKDAVQKAILDEQLNRNDAKGIKCNNN